MRNPILYEKLSYRDYYIFNRKENDKFSKYEKNYFNTHEKTMNLFLKNESFIQFESYSTFNIQSTNLLYKYDIMKFKDEWYSISIASKHDVYLPVGFYSCDTFEGVIQVMWIYNK